MIERRALTLGDYDDGNFCVTVDVSHRDDDRWDVTIWRNRYGSSFGVSIGSRDKAMEMARYLYAELEQEAVEEEAAARERYRRYDAEREARAEAERPAREAAARERAKRLAAAPIIEAAKCPECDHVGDPEDFDERGYECSSCGATGRGEDGRRCECNKFRARVSDVSCPECESPLPDGFETVEAREVDGDYEEVEQHA